MITHITIAFAILIIGTFLHDRAKAPRRKEYIDECFDDMYNWIQKAEHPMDLIDIEYEMNGIWQVAFSGHERYPQLTARLHDYIMDRKIQIANKKMAVDTTGELKVI